MKTQNSGFTLIELVIAIFILVFAIVGVYNSFSTIVILTAGASSRFTAAYLAEEGIEIVRNMRDNNWLNNRDWKTGLSDINTNCSNGCQADYKTGTSADTRFGLWVFGSSGDYLNIGENGFYSYDNIGNFVITKFKRKIIITSDSINPNVLKISIFVTWEEKGEIFDMEEVEVYLYNWY